MKAVPPSKKATEKDEEEDDDEDDSDDDSDDSEEDEDDGKVCFSSGHVLRTEQHILRNPSDVFPHLIPCSLGAKRSICMFWCGTRLILTLLNIRGFYDRSVRLRARRPRKRERRG